MIASDLLPFPVWLRIVKTSDGRLVVTELHLGERHGKQDGGPFEIRSRDLRKLSLPKILADVAHSISPVRPVAEVDVSSPARRRTDRLDRAFLEKVAALYRESMEHEPTKPYAYFTRKDRESHPDVWTPSTSTARRWVWEARRAGLLGRAIRGRAGEQPAERARRELADGEQAIQERQGHEGRDQTAPDGR